MNTRSNCGAADDEAGVENGAARDTRWQIFQQINSDRRAIRDFDGGPIADEDVKAVISEALLAPSSRNSQPYVIHWVRDPAAIAACAAACHNQRAARSAATMLVFVCSIRIALGTASLFRSYVQSAPELSEKSKAYHLRELKTSTRFLQFASLMFWSPVHSLLAAIFPSLTLAPLGPKAVRNWVARGTLFAAQTVLLAASARQLDSCPMEGFDARKLARILGLRRGDVIAIVVALGRRRPDALLEQRWRRPCEIAVQVH